LIAAETASVVLRNHWSQEAQQKYSLADEASDERVAPRLGHSQLSDEMKKLRSASKNFLNLNFL
jgi:hypothetical protein